MYLKVSESHLGPNYAPNPRTKLWAFHKGVVVVRAQRKSSVDEQEIVREEAKAWFLDGIPRGNLASAWKRVRTHRNLRTNQNISDRKRRVSSARFPIFIFIAVSGRVTFLFSRFSRWYPTDVQHKIQLMYALYRQLRLTIEDYLLFIERVLNISCFQQTTWHE